MIELLVVISIIALLIAILLPVLSAARESARAINCLANIRSFAQAAVMYAADHQDRLPGCNGEQGGEAIIFPAWATRLLDYTSDAYQAYRCPSRGPEYEWEHAMQGDADAPAWATTFATQATAQNYGLALNEAIPNGSAGMNFSYGYNDWGITSWPNNSQAMTGTYKAGAGGDMWRTNLDPYVKTSELGSPSDFFLLSDRGDDDLQNTSQPYRWNIDPLQSAAEEPAALHQDGSNVAFGDGHGANVKKADMLLSTRDVAALKADPIEADIARRWNSSGRVDPAR